MKIVTVQDGYGRTHTFRGEVQFFVGPEGCEIIDFSQDGNKTVAHFSKFSWVKSRDDGASAKPEENTPQNQHDPFTVKDIEDRDHSEVDFAKVQDHAPIEDAKPIEEEEPINEEMPSFEELKEQHGIAPDDIKTKPKKPPCETCDGLGTVLDPDGKDEDDTMMCPDC